MTSPRRLILGVLCLLLIGLGVWQVWRLSERYYLGEDRLRAESALRLTVSALTGHLARYEAVPELLAELDAIKRLVSNPEDGAQVATINALLEERNTALQSTDIYIIGRDGVTIAASNHRRPDSFVGQSFSYRPYFQGAITGRPTRFYGLGTTSGIRGYYFAAPITGEDGEVAGVVAIKVALDAIEESWREGEYRIFVSDPEGIVFMSSVENWLYGGLLPLTPDRLQRTEQSRRYSDALLFPLHFTRSQVGGVELLGRVTDDRRDYIAVSQESPTAGWTVHVLLDATAARTQAALVAFAFALLVGLFAAAAAMVQQRRLRQQERLALQVRAREELEGTVARRTADLNTANLQLAEEIGERRQAEEELHRMQASLVQAGKLAALGQMSAALSHEINQPLAAARNYADNAMILLERNDVGRARDNVGRILALVDRMAAIGKHLRNVARNPDEKLGSVDLAALIEETRTIVSARLDASQAVLEVSLDPKLPPIRAGVTRLQQVLVNLIGNAADAAAEVQDRRIHLSAAPEDGRVVIRIRDHGPGVPAAIMERIFDPFFTTKRVGSGLGLGLSISYNIVKDFGGDIRVTNTGDGAEFAVILDAASGMEGAAA